MRERGHRDEDDESEKMIDGRWLLRGDEREIFRWRCTFLARENCVSL